MVMGDIRINAENFGLPDTKKALVIHFFADWRGACKKS
jgi:hypothetical protein